MLVNFLGLCPFLGISSKVSQALGMGLATSLVLTLSAMLSYALDQWILAPYDAEHLRTLAFILTVAVLVQATEITLRATSPVLHRVLGLYLPLITSNCAVLGVALLNSRASYSLWQSAWYGLGAAAGFTLALTLFAALRERIDRSDIPQAFAGVPIALITAGVMSLAFMGFAGMFHRGSF